MKKKTRTMKNFGKFNGSINKGTVILRSANMLIREFALVILSYLRVISGTDCRWSNFVEFWSDVICSIENYKTVSFHRMLDNNKRSTIIIPRCFDAFTHQVVRKCRTTIVSRTFMFQDSENASFVDSNEVIRREWSSIWKIRSSDTFSSRAVPAVTEKIPIRRNQNVYRQNTWNVQVLLANDIRSFDLISKEDSTFAWNSRDRFIVLVARQKAYGRQHESNLTIDNILKTLWYERKVYNIFVSEMVLVNDSALIDRAVYTYNPFAKINESAWGKTEIIDVKTVEQASNALSDLTYRWTKNLNGYELRVGMLERNQSVTTENPVEAYNTLRKYMDVFKGFDEIMLDTMARYMNFKVKQVYPMDNRRFGYQLPNGTYVGAIGDVVYGRVDVCFESFFVKTYGANVDDIEFTTHVEFDRVCIFVPKASKIPKWLRIYHFFPPSIWICSIASHVLTYVTWHFLQIFAPKRKEKINFLTTVYRSFLFNVGCPSVRLPDRSAERILLTGVFFASITITGIFNGILYNSFANDMFYQDIDDLEDLDASGLPIIFTSFSVNDILGSKRDADASQFIQNLRNKLLHGHHALNIAAYYRNVSGLIRAHHFPIMRAEYVDSDGAPLLHLIEECPGTYYLSYLLPKNSILRRRINVLISRLNQAGLPTLWTSRTIRSIVARKKLIAKQNRPPIEKEANLFVPFKLSDMQTSFYMLLVGLSISTLIFFYEIGWLKTPSLRNEKFKSN